MTRFRIWAGTLALTLFPACAQAQFTGVVQPPARRAAAKPDSAALRAREDSLRGTASQQMHAWLDSVNRELGIDTIPHAEPNFFARTDSARLSDHATEPGARADDRAGATPAESASPDRGGMHAPDTATPLPSVALLGLAAIGAGLVLLGRRPGRRSADTGALGGR